MITRNDFDDEAEMSRLLDLIDNINEDYVHSVTDEISLYQPFMLSMLLGYNFDVKEGELEEIMKIYFLVWEAFRKKRNIKNIKLTERYFEDVQRKNIAFLKYWEGESLAKDKAQLIKDDWASFYSKDLFALTLERFYSRPDLIRMKEETKGIIIIGLKSLIESLERISQG